MIAYFCDQCQSQIDPKTLTKAPKSDEPLFCQNCTKQQEQSNQLVCDGCQASVLPIELRTQKALVQNQLLYCSKCVRKLAKHSRFTRQNQMSQFFVFICFPIFSALILFAIFSSLQERNSSQTANATSSEEQESSLAHSQVNEGHQAQKFAPTKTLSTEELMRLQQEKKESSSKKPLAFPPKKEDTFPPPSQQARSFKKEQKKKNEKLPLPPSLQNLNQFKSDIQESREATVLEQLNQPATCLLTLLEIQESSPAILTKLHSLLVSQDALIRSTTARTLGRLKSPQSVEHLIRLVLDPETMVQTSAQDALQHITGDRYVNFKDLAVSENAKKEFLKALRD